MSDVDAEKSVALPHAVPAAPELFLRSQWTEEDGNVLWYVFPICEPPYMGTPLDAGHPVAVIAHQVQTELYVGGWPGYHTHWTRIQLPRDPGTITLWPVGPVNKEFLGNLEVGTPYQGRVAAENPDQWWVIGNDNEERLYPKSAFRAEEVNERNRVGTQSDGRG